MSAPEFFLLDRRADGRPAFDPNAAVLGHVMRSGEASEAHSNERFDKCSSGLRRETSHSDTRVFALLPSPEHGCDRGLIGTSNKAQKTPRMMAPAPAAEKISVRGVSTNFTVQGEPTADSYGGTFEYTTPAPLVDSPTERTVWTLAVDRSLPCIAFCIFINAAALAVVLPRIL